MTTSREIIDNPKRVFARLPLPITLQEHLIRVAAVADTICKQWTGPVLDRDTIVAACLLHDIGNIMKMDFEAPTQKLLMARDTERVLEFIDFQRRARDHYGDSPDAVRAGLMKQAAVEPALMAFIEQSSSANMPHMLATNDFAGMIYLYADNRVIPSGVCTLAERIADAKKRYPKYYEAPHRAAVKYEQRLSEMEQAIQAHCSLLLDSITDEIIATNPLWKALP